MKKQNKMASDACSGVSAELAVLNITILVIAFVKAVIWLASPKDGWSLPTSHSSEHKSESQPEVENQGGGHTFVWRGHEAQEAYREKHWESYRR